MTMPSKIWASEAKSGYGEWQSIVDGMPCPETYIRADIAEELARAASKVTRSYWNETDGIISGMCELEDALTRFRAITP